MIPFIVAGGILFSLAVMLNPAGAATPETGWLAGLAQIGLGGLTLFVPVLGGYIAYSIADKPGLAPGMIGAYLAKEMGAHVTAEVTPHHFSLNEDAVLTKGTLAKMNPPLRTEADRQAIIRGLQDGTIDLIATDHAPHADYEKAKPLTEAPSGIIGLETSLALGNEALVDTGELTMMQLLTCMTINPAKLYRLDAGYLAENGPADLVLFDPAKEWVPERFYSKSQNSPFLGQKLKGKVEYTICKGKVIFEA